MYKYMNKYMNKTSKQLFLTNGHIYILSFYSKPYKFVGSRVASYNPGFGRDHAQNLGFHTAPALCQEFKPLATRVQPVFLNGIPSQSVWGEPRRRTK